MDWLFWILWAVAALSFVAWHFNGVFGLVCVGAILAVILVEHSKVGSL